MTTAAQLVLDGFPVPAPVRSRPSIDISQVERDVKLWWEGVVIGEAFKEFTAQGGSASGRSSAPDQNELAGFVDALQFDSRICAKVIRLAADQEIKNPWHIEARIGRASGVAPAVGDGVAWMKCLDKVNRRASGSKRCVVWIRPIVERRASA